MKKVMVFLILVLVLFFSTVSHARLMETTFSGTLNWDPVCPGCEPPPDWLIDTGIIGTAFSGKIVYDDSVYPSSYWNPDGFDWDIKYPIVSFTVSWGGRRYHKEGVVLQIFCYHCGNDIRVDFTIDEFPDQYQDVIGGVSFPIFSPPPSERPLGELFPDGLIPNYFGLDIPGSTAENAYYDYWLFRDLIGTTNSEVSLYCVLASKFVKTTLSNGMRYYTDRDYTLTNIPSVFVGMETILTPNDDRNRTAAGDYLTFEMPYDGMVYVAYDSRATSLPNWLSGFSDTGDRIYTSLSTQPYLKVYKRAYYSGDCVNLGANKAPGFSGGTVSNYMVFYGEDSGTSSCILASKFNETTLSNGMRYYTDRDYTLTSVPSVYIGMETIITPNDDRNLTAASDYLTFEMPYDGTVYVAYDSRAISEPNWMNGFIDTGDTLQTSLSTQPSLKIYSQNYGEGDCVNFGANKAPGFIGGTVSNYIVFYGNGNGGPVDCMLDSKFEKSTINVSSYYYTDRNYTITGGVPDWMVGRTLIQTPNDERNNNSASGYIRFTTPVSYWVYVLFDSRSSSVPNWLSGWERYTKYPDIKTSLATQPGLKMYRKMFDAGQCVDLGGNYGLGSSSEIRSNYVVVYGN